MSGSGDAREDLASRIAEEIMMMYQEAEVAIKKEIARKFAKGLDATDWAAQKRVGIGALRRAAEIEVRKLDKGISTVPGHMEDAYRAGAESAKVNIEVGFYGTNTPAIKVLANELVSGIRTAHFQILRRVNDEYRRAITDTLHLSASGVYTRRQAAMKAMDELVKSGFGRFVDKSGRAWSLQSYVEMSTRTGLSRTMLQGRLDAYQAAGHDLVIISDAPEECSVCRPWEGRILSISGQDKSHASLATARAAGLFHPNCRHSANRWIKGLTKPLYNTKTADPKGDELRQQQRYLERQVRKKKEKVAVNKAWLENDKNFEARRALVKSEEQLKTAKSKLDTFITENDRKRRRDREQIKSAY